MTQIPVADYHLNDYYRDLVPFHLDQTSVLNITKCLHQFTVKTLRASHSYQHIQYASVFYIYLYIEVVTQ